VVSYRWDGINNDTLCRPRRLDQPSTNATEQARNRERWMESDPKRIVREWNREIEAEMRRHARQDDGPWKIVVGVVLAVLWFVALFAVLALFERLQQ
jgi:hypothetical protein